MIKYLKYIGLWKTSSFVVLSREKYKPIKSTRLAERHLLYLKDMEAYQVDRRNTIESKNSQLIGQASIVSSIFFLFISLLIDNFHELSTYLRITVTSIFAIDLWHYLLTIIHATKNLEISRYKYPNRSTSTITKKNKATNEKKFVNEEINDLVFILERTTEIDNQKGENLLFAARCFQIANIGFGVLTIVIILIAFYI